MSTVHSTPPPATAGQQAHPVGFNDQTYYDPFFPSAPSEENLVPIESDFSPDYHSYHTPTPPQTSIHDSISNAHDYDQQGLPVDTNYVNGFSSLLLPNASTDNATADTTYDFITPDTYMSDASYITPSEHTATPDFGAHGYYTDENHGMLDTSNHLELNDCDPFPNDQVHQLQTTTNSDYAQSSTYARNQAGVATLSSHLMSPVLTDSRGPSSRHGTDSPPQENRIKSENQDETSAAKVMQNFQQKKMDHNLGFPQITPSVTESSKDTSPEISSTVPDIARAVSPIIRVDGYSRGDSPARSSVAVHQSRGKRSRAGSNTSHLAVQHNTNEEEQQADEDYFGSNQAPIEQAPDRSGLDPRARDQISDMEVPTIKEQELQAQIALKNIDVVEWLDNSEAGVDVKTAAPPSLRPDISHKRQRAKSAGAQTLSRANLESFEANQVDSHIPGPGLLIDEESGDDNDYDEADLASIEDPPSSAIGEPVNENPGDAMPGVYNELPTQPPLHRVKLWQDPLYDSSDPGIKMQPETANAAIKRFQERAGDIETLSRMATWGTRRVSESDLHGLFNQLSFSEKTQEPVKPKRDRRSSFLQQISGRWSYKKSHGNLNRQDSDKSITLKDQSGGPPPVEHMRKDSQDGRKDSLGVPQTPSSNLKRMSSLNKKPKSPRINTGSAVAAMALQAGALGAGGSVSATGNSSPTSWPKNMMKRSRSRSELNQLRSQGPASSSSTELGRPGLADMWTKQGGPPMPALATPLKNEETLNSLGGVEGDDEEADEDRGIKMEFPIRSDLIVPTLEGFKSNVRDLNPRLPPFMFDRIAQEQLRRFKKLLDFKIKHVQALSTGKCASENHCTELGGEPTYLPSRSGNREQENAQASFTVAGLTQSDEDTNALAEGIVTPAQFPAGVPLPPVQRLPAEFECSICFKVKRFQKPSDWSKHVHEDVQPFTCTFPTCAEPKSFKRKADWVRHENERHRQLEWWMCNINECSHKCYRKDNFVQHLVREHKLPEPKVKTHKVGKPAVRGPSSQKARTRQGDDAEESTDEVWRLVDECRHETPKNPKDEACKFCGNICNSWKKLTVHLAKHMEQISMPVLNIVKQKDVTPDTIISPIEQRIASQQTSMSPTPQSPFSSTTHATGIPQYRSLASDVSGLPGNFASLHPQSQYMGEGSADLQTANYQRVSSNTYPPVNHAQHLSTGLAQTGHGGPSVPNYSTYAESPTSQFHTVNASRGFTHPRTSGPNHTYPAAMAAPTSQLQSSPYASSNSFQYVSQQQQPYSSPDEGGVFQFGTPSSASYPQQRSPPTSYPMQHNQSVAYSQQQASLPSQMPVQYGPMGQIPNYSQASGNASLYVSQQSQQQQQQYPYNQ